eukprot:2986283-Rhodomonas_salina.1
MRRPVLWEGTTGASAMRSPPLGYKGMSYAYRPVLSRGMLGAGAQPDAGGDAGDGACAGLPWTPD